MSTESLKRVLMAIKGEARGMRKNKLESRINPKKPEVEVEELAVVDGEEPKLEEKIAGMSPDEEVDAPSEEPSEEEKTAAIEEIRRLLARS